jgi:dTDP-4-amino-4,6-dideoxygalactose transaminase
MIPVTKPYLPPYAEYEAYLKSIWQRDWLTNNGPLVSELELKLKEYLDQKHLLYLANGTLALQLAIKALGLTGEIITTPFSFVATTSSIVWEGCTPVFVDIDRKSLNIDASKIEAAITENTSAILATHVYGNPCAIDKIRQIADKHGLKVIYDAAHAFGVTYKGRSVFSYGDISICSLHATKLYHSVEGGLVMTQDAELLKTMAYMRNFGFDGPTRFAKLGINAKNSELHAAMGLANLRHIDSLIARRKELTGYYDQMLKGLKAVKPVWNDEANHNYAYYPIIFESEALMLQCFQQLNLHDIFPRRYFYPSLAAALPYLSAVDMAVTDDVAPRVLCLPLYHDLSMEEINLVCRLMLRIQNN